MARRTRIKICGIRDAAAARAAADAGADAIGMVFVPRSPRHVTMDQAREILAALPAFVEAVGLFVDKPIEQVLDIAHDLCLGAVQLHGSETPAEIAELVPLRVIKSLPFSADLPSQLPQWRAACGVLIDTPSLGAELPGGGGRVFDWAALAAMKLDSIVLAGGLTPDNVGQAVRTVHPYAVDVSSGVESSRGVKSHDLIRRFCDAVRAADQIA